MSASGGPTAHRLAAMEARDRRRALFLTMLRSAALFVLIMALYFLVPVGERSGDTSGVMRLVLGVLVFAAVLAWQIRQIFRSTVPTLQAVEALIVAIPTFIVVYASSYASLSAVAPGSFTQPVDKVAALYFTIVTLGTVGYGDIAPVSTGARLAVSSQVMLDLVLIAFVVRLLTSAAKRSLSRQAEPPS